MLGPVEYHLRIRTVTANYLGTKGISFQMFDDVSHYTGVTLHDHMFVTMVIENDIIQYTSLNEVYIMYNIQSLIH